MNLIPCLCHLAILLFSIISARAQCKFPDHKDQSVSNFTNSKLSALQGKRFSTSDAAQEYRYEVGVCTHAEEDPDADHQTAGVIQTDKAGQLHKNAGKITNCDIKAGYNWIMLEYKDGDAYHSHCNSTKRSSTIMFICNPNEHQGKLRILEENNQKSVNCYYLFELEHSSICSATTSGAGVSVGAIVIVIFLLLLSAYLLLGFFYQRFVVGAKGFEQVPNFAFWQNLGALIADGCNFVFRCGVAAGQEEYRGVNTIDDDDFVPPARDEDLLPM